MPYHRKDGTQIIDEARLVLEDSGAENKVWAVQSSTGTGGWELPRWEISPTAAMVGTTTSAWDASNVIGDIQELALQDLSVQLPWLSWIADSKTDEGGERLCRVYGHLLSKGDPIPAVDAGRFIDPVELHALAEREWVRQWVEEIDSAGRPVRRGLGVAKETMFSYGNPGKERGTYRVGVFGEDGLPVPNPLAL